MTFQRAKALNPDNPTFVACGQCIGCRLDKVDQAATRCMHEAKMWPTNCFLSLTFDDEHLPEDYSVNIRTLQLFHKRLRKLLPQKIRTYGCGEYGDLNQRPHYHSLIFNADFHNDRKLYKHTESGPLYTSPTLSKAWPFGFSTIGSVTYASAAYVAGYATKKIGGDRAASHYVRTHPITGEIVQVEPEFAKGSTRPGIGYTWFVKYKSDVFPSDFVVVDGREKAVPAYYHRKLSEEENHELKLQRAYHPLKGEHNHRKRQAKLNSTPERLAVREAVKTDRISRSKRTL